MIDYKKIIAASLKLDIDYDTMAYELMESMKDETCVPFSYDNCTAYSLFLRETTNAMDYSYRGAKSADISSWQWNNKLNISYTISVVESLPFIKLGTVRVVYFPNIHCKEHTDWDDPTDYEHTLGLSLIPNTADTECKVWIEKDLRWASIPGNAMLLNDSIKHEVPTARGTRITMRLFGTIDYTKLLDKIVPEHCYLF